MMYVRYQDETPWLFELGTFLTDRGLSDDDITAAVMYVKEELTDTDEAALVSKSIAGETITIAADGNALQVSISSTDFGTGKMEIGGTYYVGIGLTVTGYSGVYLEPILKDNQVTVTQDLIRS